MAIRIPALALASCLGIEGFRRVVNHGTRREQAETSKLGQSLAQLGAAAKQVEQTWVVFADEDTADDKIHALCQRSKKCLAEGHPSEGGVPFFEVGARGGAGGSPEAT